jgi:histidinol-phosphate aminotransferase
MQTCMAYLDDDEVIVSRSSFPVYDVFARAMRARLIKTPLKDYRLDLEAMRLAITAKTKLVFVCNPNNPTGTLVTAAEVEALVRAVPQGVLIIFDEAYFDFVDSPAYPTTVPYVHAGRGNIMVLRSYSKVYGLAGVRLGYAIADPDVLAPLDKIKEPFCVNSFAQAAGVAALQDQDYLQHSIAVNAAGRAYLYRRFDDMGLSYVRSHTNFLLVRIGPEAREVAQALLAEGIIVRPCAAYDLPEFLRITVGDPAQNARLAGTLERVLRAAP